MMNTSRLLDLSKIIQNSIETIHNSLAEKNLPFPTFDPNGSTGVPEELSTARDAVLDASSELHDLLLLPIDLILNQTSHNNMATLQAIVRFSIAGKLPLNDRVSYSTLSELTGIPKATLKRFIRHAITMRVFEESETGTVSHTNLSRLLAEPMTSSWLKVGSEELWPSATKTVDAICKWPEAQEPNETGFSLANNTTQSLYDIFNTNPARAAQFSDSLKIHATNPGFAVSHVLNIYDWEALGTGTVVDVGGNVGDIAIALATQFPKLNLIVQDMESTIRNADVAIEIASRVKFMAHDFFTEQPVRGAVAFYLRWILHNHSDKYCIQILRNLIPALKGGTRILIHEICLPEPGIGPLWKERSLRSFDMTMLANFNGKERDFEDWKALFKQADERFEFIGLKELEGSALSLVEMRWSE